MNILKPSPFQRGRVAVGGGLVVNDSPVDCQSQTVTEPQRDPLAVDEVYLK